MEDTFELLFGASRLREFWDKQVRSNPKLQEHQVLKKRGYQEKAIVVALHGDGAEYMNDYSLVTVSFCGLLKDGPIAETNLFLACWPKNNTVKGPGGTWDMIWRWLVWDFNQLFHNKFADTDPWNNPLPAHLAARVGQAILPNGRCGLGSTRRHGLHVQ